MFFAAIFEHLLERLAVIVRTRHGTVYIRFYDDDAVPLCVLPANPQLSFDGLFRLVGTAVPRVNRRCLHNFVLRIFLPKA